MNNSDKTKRGGWDFVKLPNGSYVWFLRIAFLALLPFTGGCRSFDRLMDGNSGPVTAPEPDTVLEGSLVGFTSSYIVDTTGYTYTAQTVEIKNIATQQWRELREATGISFSPKYALELNGIKITRLRGEFDAYRITLIQ
jgi:hypothetical protein